MPVFNDFSHYYVGGGAGHTTTSTPSYSSSGYNAHSSSSSYSFPSPYSNRTHTNYFPSNYQSTNILSNIASSGISSRYYGGSPTKNTNYGYNYKGRSNYSDSKPNSYNPSPYTTYSLWKENQIAAKWRKDNYKWRNPNNSAKPVYIDTTKINVNQPRVKRQEIPNASETIPERSKLVERPMVRDEMGTIKRGRTVVRMHTKMLKENPYLKKNEKCDNNSESDEEGETECRFNRMSPIRISRLKKRSVLQYKRHDSGNKHWLDTESSGSDSNDSENSMPRKNTLKSRNIARLGTIKREATIKNKEAPSRDGSVNRRYHKIGSSKDLSQTIDAVHNIGGEVKKTDRRLSMEMYEEQAAILDSMIQAELDREDADDYFSDPKRGTVKIKGRSNSKANLLGQSTDSNTDEEDVKKKVRRSSKPTHQKGDNDIESLSERSTPSSSRRNSLFQDLLIGDTISETFIEDLENKIQHSYTNTEKVLQESMPKLRLGTVKITQKLSKKPSRFEVQPSNSDAKISAIVEVEENKPKTPKFFIDDVKIEASQFSFEDTQCKEETGQPKQTRETTKKEKQPIRLENRLKNNLKSSLPNNTKPTDLISKPNIGTPINSLNVNVIDNKQKQEVKTNFTPTINSEVTLNSKFDLKTKDLVMKDKESLKSDGNITASLDMLKKDCAIVVPCETHLSSGEEINKSLEANLNFPKISLVDDTKIVQNITPDDNGQTTKNELNSSDEKSKKNDQELSRPEIKDSGVNDEVSTNGKLCDSVVSNIVSKQIQMSKKPLQENISSSKDAQNLEEEKKESIRETLKVRPEGKETSLPTATSPSKDLNAKEKNEMTHKSEESQSFINNLLENTTNLAECSFKKTENVIIPQEKQPSFSKVKPKIKSETNKKISKMKDVKSEEKDVELKKTDCKLAVDEKRVAQEVDATSAEEKSQKLNQKGNTLKMTAKKSDRRKKESCRPRKPSAIVHMKPRAMAIRTVENHPPSLKTPRQLPLPQPTQALIEIIPTPAFEETDSSSESSDESTATEGSSSSGSEASSDASDTASDSSSDSQGNQRNSTTSLDSGFGSACYKTKKGIALQFRLLY